MALIEFKDLPDTTTPLTADNLNNNFEYLEAKIDSGEIYSTNEIKTNKTYIDDNNNEKPVYRKTVIYTLPNDIAYSGNSSITFSHNIENFDFCVEAKGFWQSNYYVQNNIIGILPYLGSRLVDDSYEYNGVTTLQNISRTAIFICARYQSWAAGTKFKVIIEYTKTTD